MLRNHQRHCRGPTAASEALPPVYDILGADRSGDAVVARSYDLLFDPLGPGPLTTAWEREDGLQPLKVEPNPLDPTPPMPRAFPQALAELATALNRNAQMTMSDMPPTAMDQMELWLEPQLPDSAGTQSGVPTAMPQSRNAIEIPELLPSEGGKFVQFPVQNMCLL